MGGTRELRTLGTYPALVRGGAGATGGARSAFIDSACGAEIDLRDEVLSLLAAHERSAEFDELPTSWLSSVGVGERSSLDPGESVAGRYVIQRLLGRGGMGEVYEAWDKELLIPVALKTLRVHSRGKDDLLHLKREGLLARSISHPNICRVYDLGRHQDADETAWFLTMELLRGETLADRLRARGKLAPEIARPLAEQMAAGLGAAHQAGVIHRDFKPGNVMLVGEVSGEQAIVTDFGIARAAAVTVEQIARSSEPQLIGTPAYMAPEQLKGDQVGPAADIYALGLVMYEMVTGRLPFMGGLANEAVRRRLEEEAPSPRTFAPELDESLGSGDPPLSGTRPEAALPESGRDRPKRSPAGGRSALKS